MSNTAKNPRDSLSPFIYGFILCFVGIVWGACYFADQGMLLDLTPFIENGLVHAFLFASLMTGLYFKSKHVPFNFSLLMRNLFGTFVLSALIIVGLEMTLNKGMDRLPPQRHIVQVLGKYHTSGRSSANGVILQSWRRGHGEEYLEVDRWTYLCVSPKKSSMEVDVKSGWLGYPWISNYRLINS